MLKWTQLTLLHNFTILFLLALLNFILCHFIDTKDIFNELNISATSWNRYLMQK